MEYLISRRFMCILVLSFLFPPFVHQDTSFENRYAMSFSEGFLGLELVPMIIGEKKSSQQADLRLPPRHPAKKMLNKLEAVNCETWSTMAAMKTRCAYYLGMAFFEIDLISSFFPPRDSSKLSSVTSFPKAFSKLAKKTPQLPHGHMTLFHGDTVSLHSLAISGQKPKDPVRTKRYTKN